MRLMARKHKDEYTTAIPGHVCRFYLNHYWTLMRMIINGLLHPLLEIVEAATTEKPSVSARPSPCDQLNQAERQALIQSAQVRALAKAHSSYIMHHIVVPLATRRDNL